MDVMDKITNMRKYFNYSNSKIGYKLEDKEEFGIVRDTLVKYGMPTKNFDNNLSSLIINEKYNEDKSSGKNGVIAGSYSASLNKINLPEEKEDFIHELFHMASNIYSDNLSENNGLKGCEIRKGDKKFGESLSDGITDYFTSLAVPNYMQRYPVETLIVSYLVKIYGIDNFKDHFNQFPKKFYSSFKEDEEDIKKIVGFLDEFYRTYWLIYNLIDQINNKGCSEKEKQDEINDIYKKHAEGVASNFVKCIIGFVKLMQSKDLDDKWFVSDLIGLLNTKNNECMKKITNIFKYSSYLGKENVIQDIVEKTDEESFGL